jgi:uncharacterized protein
VYQGAVASAAAEQELGYAMSPLAATMISGNESIEVLDQNLAVVVNFQPLTAAEMQGLREQCRKLAADSRYELFKTADQV